MKSILKLTVVAAAMLGVSSLALAEDNAPAAGSATQAANVASGSTLTSVVGGVVVLAAIIGVVAGSYDNNNSTTSTTTTH
jgi:hypothetical protein